MPRNYIRSAGILSLATLASRVLGLIRDVLMASTFGAGMVMDAFVLAFTLPNLFRRLFGEGALSAAFIPTFTHTKHHYGRERALSMSEAVLTLLVILLGVLATTGMLLCWLGQYWPGLSAKSRLALQLSQILVPYLFMICLAAFLTALLQALDHFCLPALAPGIFNLCWISAVVFISPLYGHDPTTRMVVIAVVLLAAGWLQVVIHFPALYRYQIQLKLRLDLQDPGVQQVARKITPVILGIAVVQINVFLDRLIAWWCIPGQGALTVLYMANRLMQFPLALIGIAIGTAVFPLLSQHAARGDRQALGKSVVEAARLTIFLSLPAGVGLIVLAHPIVSLIYQYQAFSPQAAWRTGGVLYFYAAGIWLYSVMQVLTKAFYSLGDTRTPMRFAVKVVGVNLVLNLLLVGPLAEKGLALATLLSAIFNLTGLLILLQQQLPLPKQGLGSFLLQVGGASTLMGLGVWALSTICHLTTGLPQRLLAVGIPVLGGTLLYPFFSWLFKIPELRLLRSIIH